MKSLPLACAALLALSTSACFLQRADVNEPVNQARVAELIPGQHTAKDVTQLLGAPEEVVQLGHRSAYRYEYERVKTARLWLLVVALNGVDQRSDRVWAFFDENNVLTHIGSTFQAEDAQFELPYLGEDD